ncbi:polysaccharide deacetylase family protein [Mucilaginibacter flavus]|uniref:polysaccharide deacetylase family protein n=1 Tax=Mucilaginibacter flavus TaxID=931504 RepID=UPI0025B5A3D6|nr:polysaccharide deacetylase family protein [Mucilaginibacter flavus]MDN3580728.1 polysaccharide deacetylase family protein [Mucilaginibacter flavus]
MKCKNLLVLLLALTGTVTLKAQTAARPWNNKECAVVLTYDDAIDVDLDNVAPVLDSLKLKATFYIIGSSPVVANRMNEWRKLAARGNELGNHSLYHPCDGSLPGRGFVTAETDLSKYTVERAVKEIRTTNTLLNAIDGKTERTFAYPCGDLQIGNQRFYDELKKDFIAARGVNAELQTAKQVNPDNVDCFMINGQSVGYMIDLVEKARQSHTLLVFLFHGVGGGHNINVSLDAHSKLLHYLKANEKAIWVAPMVDVARYIKNQENRF